MKYAIHRQRDARFALAFADLTKDQAAALLQALAELQARAAKPIQE
jgi:hypothetical protein